MSLLKVWGLVLAGLIVASLAAPMVFAQPSSKANVDVAFESIISNLRGLLAYLESVNPAEAAKYREAFEKAIAKVGEAKRIAAADPAGAVREALKAQSEAVSRAAGVFRALNVTVPPGLVIALDVRLRMVEELNSTIQYLKSFNVTIDPEAEEILKFTKAKIIELKTGLIQGVLNASQVAVQLNDINRNISNVKVILAKVKGEHLKIQAVNALARHYVSIVARHSDALLRSEIPGDAVDEIEKAIILPEKLEEVIRVKLPPAFKCNITPILVEYNVKIEPGFLGRLIAKIAKGNMSKVAEIVNKIRKCLVQPLAIVEKDLEKIPGVVKVEVEKAKNIVEKVKVEVKPTHGKIENKTIEISLKITPQEMKGEKTIDLGTLTLGNTVQVRVIGVSAGAGLKIMANGQLILKGHKQSYEINMPCMVDVEIGCARVMIVIPGYDEPMKIEPGEYKAALKINWEAQGAGILLLKIVIETK